MEVQKGPFQEEVVFLQGFVHFHVSWWEGSHFLLDSLQGMNSPPVVGLPSFSSECHANVSFIFKTHTDGKAVLSA